MPYKLKKVVHKKNMRTIIGILLLFLSFKTLACDCKVSADTRTYLSEVEFIFTGKIVELIKAETKESEIPVFLDTIPGAKEQWRRMNPDQYYARVIMIDNIKGNTLKTDTLLFISEFTNCDPRYELNQSYLFFADQIEFGKFRMVHCTPWGKLEDSKRTIEELKKYKSIKHNK